MHLILCRHRDTYWSIVHFYCTVWLLFWRKCFETWTMAVCLLQSCFYMETIALFMSCLYKLVTNLSIKYFVKKVYSVKKKTLNHTYTKNSKNFSAWTVHTPLFLSIYIYTCIVFCIVFLVTVSLRLVKYVCHKETDADLWTDLQQCLCLLSNKQ